jgi:FixJ family two-component response regulator
MTVSAMKAGAVEFLTKPFDDDVLLSAIRNAIERSRTALEHEAELRALRIVTRPSPAASSKSWRWWSLAC